jgi:hypothetical protein
MITLSEIRRRSAGDVLDYQQLVSYLRDYSKPRDRISAFLASGDLIRVRKGLYVFGESYRKAPINREVLANFIYGPSYVSLDYALSYYGLIPERVVNVTSVTTGANRRFTTPLGVFTYRAMTFHRYASHYTLAGDANARFLVATPEKALVDKVWTDKRFHPRHHRDFEAYLFSDLRMDEQRVASLDRTRISAITKDFSSRRINMLSLFLSSLKGCNR